MADKREQSRPATGGRFAVAALFILCAGLLVIDPLIYKDGYFEIETTFGFYAIAGASAALIVAAGGWLLGRLLLQPGEEGDD